MNQTNKLSPAAHISYGLRRATTAMIVVSSLCVFSYCVLLLMTLIHATSQHRAQEEMRTLVSDISTLEGRYISQTTLITDDRGASLGLVKPSAVTTVYTQASARQLSLQTVQ